jgi:hypothetical protein
MINDAGFVKGLLVIAILLISLFYKEVIFASFFNCPLYDKNELWTELTLNWYIHASYMVYCIF